MSTGAVWRSCEAAATRRGRCELRAGRSELRLGSRRNLPAGPARYLLGLRSPRAEPYTGIGVDSTFLSAWSIIDGCTLQTRFLRIFGTTTTRHMITRLSSLYSQWKGRRACSMATHHISAHRTHRRCILRFSPHDLVCTEHSQLYPLRPPSSDSFDGLITPVVSLSSLRALRHLFRVRRSVVGAHAHAHALHPCTVCPRACRDKGSRVLGSWACKCTRLNSRRLRARTRNGRVHASAGLRGHKLRCLNRAAV